MTEYVILVEDEGKWEELGLTTASGPRTAIRQAINGGTGAAPKEGRFVAVPSRSWRPVPVRPETKTTLRFY